VAHKFSGGAHQNLVDPVILSKSNFLFFAANECSGESAFRASCGQPISCSRLPGSVVLQKRNKALFFYFPEWFDGGDPEVGDRGRRVCVSVCGAARMRTTQVSPVQMGSGNVYAV
jgi:hypothetical protein